MSALAQITTVLPSPHQLSVPNLHPSLNVQGHLLVLTELASLSYQAKNCRSNEQAIDGAKPSAQGLHTMHVSPIATKDIHIHAIPI
jgi:hypothetical protein